MGNYLEPISDWAQQILEEREKNPIAALYKTPFVVMYSGAIIGQGSSKNLSEKDYQKRKEEIDNLITDGQAKYRGCIISNNVNSLELSYSPNKTPVGVDFDGNVIYVDGESGKKISTPIITSVDVDTEEFHNAIKTTKIGVKCFSLKQLEMFELFFMKPGMSVMVEWGDSSLLKRQNIGLSMDGTYSDISEALFINKVNHNFNTFCEKFSSVFVPKTDELKIIIENVKKSKGSYDYTAGKVSDYTYSISEDGTYDISITLFQSNQISLAIPINYGTKSGKNANAKPTTTLEELMIVDFNLPANATAEMESILGKNYKNHFFNFNSKNITQEKTIGSKDTYISLHFILAYLINVGIPADDEVYRFEIPMYNNVPLIPVHTSPWLISSSKDIIFPNKQFPHAIADGKKTDDKYDDEIVLTKYSDIKDSKLKKLDGSINGLSFNVTGPIQINVGDKTETLDNIGNALNIFIAYKKVVEIYNKNYSKMEILKDILNIINSNSYGLIGLTIQPAASQSTNSTKPTIVDSRFTNNIPEKTYRFKPTTINSCVKEFIYNFQMDNLIAGYTFFNAAATLRQAFAKKAGDADPNDKDAIPKLPFPSTNYRAFDYGAYANADGYYSINNVEKKAQEKYWEKYKEIYAKSKSAQISIGFGKETTKDPAPDLNSILSANKLFFTGNLLKGKQSPVPLIYLDKKVVQAKIRAEDEIRSILTNLSISITIDGFSGLRAGQVFTTDGVPEIYNQIGAFQITNIKQNITPEEGWKTTIEATWRIGMQK